MSSQKGFVGLIILLITAGLLLLGGGYYLGTRGSGGLLSPKGIVDKAKSDLANLPTTQTDIETPLTATQVDLHTLPLGDKKSATAPKKGYIYTCRKAGGSEMGGAGGTGPWINQTNKKWDLTKKVHVDGSVSWPIAKWKISSDGTTRTLITNDLPSHTTGVYPIASTDDAYAYDRNPNSIKAQSDITLSIPTNPALLVTPECVGGEIGIMLSGTALFNGFDATERDAAAWEVQDSCSGHPQVSGLYHYHSYSTCLKDETSAAEHSALLGYAFDGFGIYGLKSEGGKEVSTADLDECHGHTHTINWDGKETKLFHYHMTQDFPYSVSCFKGKKQVNGPLGGGGQMP